MPVVLLLYVQGIPYDFKINRRANTQMIKAKLNDGTLVFGLSKVNINKLQKGDPILFNMKELAESDRDVVIYVGDTEEKMAEEFPLFAKKLVEKLKKLR